jgi:hypothetical protein
MGERRENKRKREPTFKKSTNPGERRLRSTSIRTDCHNRKRNA